MSAPVAILNQIPTSIITTTNEGGTGTGAVHHPTPTTSRIQIPIQTSTSRVSDIDDDAVSVATTALASEVGSFVGRSHDAFLRSITFQCKKKPIVKRDGTAAADHDDNSSSRQSSSSSSSSSQPVVEWGITFRDVSIPKKKKQIVEIDSISGIVTLSKLTVGDRVKYINGKKLGPSYNALRSQELMFKSIARDKFLSITTGNDEGNDILVQATIIKPKPTTTYKELGMVVWIWGTLCIKSISKDSLFKQSVLKSEDSIVSINDIDCETVSAEGFARIMTELPQDITIVVKRSKQRWTGKFG